MAAIASIESRSASCKQGAVHIWVPAPWVRRSYTIASSAAQTTYVETTIKREAPGIFSDYMHDQIVEGDLVDVIGSSGVFNFKIRRPIASC
jgi:ferredoxin-NADP reductase